MIRHHIQAFRTVALVCHTCQPSITRPTNFLTARALSNAAVMRRRRATNKQTTFLTKPSPRFLHHTGTNRAIKPFLLADIGEGITECEVIQWFVEPGATVAEFDKVCEVQSDKASVEITSRFAGKVVKLYYNPNDIAKVGEPLLDIDTGEDTCEGPPTNQVDTPPPPVPSVAPGTPKETPISPRTTCNVDSRPNHHISTLATPAVRRVAKESNVDIANVQGTGKGGRVLKEDVLAYVSSAKTPSPQGTISHGAVFPPESSPDRVEPLTAVQKAMFKTMTKSLAIPHLGYNDEIELNATTEYRSALNQHITGHANQYTFPKMTYLPIFIKCLSIALTRYPIMNATLVGDGDDIHAIKLAYRQSHNVGIAMDTPQGLIVPNIKDVQTKTIFEVAAELHRLVQLGKKNALAPQDLKNGTITLSNIGAISGTYANPVVVTSELAIVALGQMRTLPRFDAAGNVVPKQIMPISWSADHRVIDGATIARFGNQWKTLIENPALLASELR